MDSGRCSLCASERREWAKAAQAAREGDGEGRPRDLAGLLPLDRNRSLDRARVRGMAHASEGEQGEGRG